MVTKIRINEDGFRSCNVGHGLQVTVMPLVSLHVILWYKRLASLCEPDYANYFHVTFHLYVNIFNLECVKQALYTVM